MDRRLHVCTKLLLHCYQYENHESTSEVVDSQEFGVHAGYEGFWLSIKPGKRRGCLPHSWHVKQGVENIGGFEDFKITRNHICEYM